jgi:hypothetical protein
MLYGKANAPARQLVGVMNKANELILHASELFDLRAYEYTVMHK